MTPTQLLKIAALAAAPFVAFTPSAHAIDAYGRVFAGVGDVSIGPFTMSGDEMGGALGIDDVGPFRLEAAVTHFDTNALGLGATAMVYSGTAYVDIPLGSQLTVSPNAGLDYASVDIGPFSTSDTGWHWGVELSHPLNDRADLTGSFTRTYLGFSGIGVEADSLQIGVKFDL